MPRTCMIWKRTNTNQGSAQQRLLDKKIVSKLHTTGIHIACFGGWCHLYWFLRGRQSRWSSIFVAPMRERSSLTILEWGLTILENGASLDKRTGELERDAFNGIRATTHEHSKAHHVCCCHCCGKGFTIYLINLARSVDVHLKWTESIHWGHRA